MKKQTNTMATSEESVQQTETQSITTRTTNKIVRYIQERGMNKQMVRLLVAEAVVAARGEGRLENRRSN